MTNTSQSNNPAVSFLSAFVLILYAGVSPKVQAQVYTKEKSQHRFAQTYIGLDTQFFPSSGELTWQNQRQQFPSRIVPRFTIGGLHFWGKIDFQANFPLTSLGKNTLQNEESILFRPGGGLGIKYYPWRLKYGKLRPFVGTSVHSVHLGLGNEETQTQRYDLFYTPTVLTGLCYATNDWQINAEASFLLNRKQKFYTSPTQKNVFNLPEANFSLGLIRYFDTTLKEERPMKLGITKAIEKQMASKGKLNSFSIAIAPSGSYFLKSPGFKEDLQSLPRHKSSFNWDAGLGYLFHTAGLHVGLSYRNYASSATSFEFEHIVRREAISFEVFKFLLDYKGFVPYVGASLSHERWAAGIFVNDVQQGTTQRSRIFSPGVLLGWDILPSPLETWVLRTNLRYYPFQEIRNIHSTKSRVDQFEFNIIQLVLYPNRWYQVRRAKRVIK